MALRCASLLITVVSISASYASAVETGQTSYTLVPGMGRVIQLGFEPGEMSVSDSKVVKAQTEGTSSLRVQPVQTGLSQITVWSKDRSTSQNYLVRVRDDATGEMVVQLEDFFRGQKISVETVGTSIVVRGEMDSLEGLVLADTMIRDLRQASSSSIIISNLTRLSQAAYEKLAERIEREISSPDITARFIANRILLEGTADSNFEADRALELAKAHLSYPRLLPDRNTAGSTGGSKPTLQKEESVVSGFTIIDMLRIRPPMRPAVKGKTPTR